MKQNKLESAREIAIRNEVPFYSALEIYARFNARLYTRELRKGNNYRIGEKITNMLYNKELDDKTFELTERYFRIKAWRDLKHNKYN